MVRLGEKILVLKFQANRIILRGLASTVFVTMHIAMHMPMTQYNFVQKVYRKKKHGSVAQVLDLYNVALYAKNILTNMGVNLYTFGGAMAPQCLSYKYL